MNLTDGAGFAFSPVQFRAGEYTLTLRGRVLRPTTLRVFLGGALAAEAPFAPIREEEAEAVCRFAAETAAPLRIEARGGEGCLCEIEVIAEA